MGISAGTVASGQMIPPIDRIKIFSPTQWEEFVLEWADSIRPEYSAVERCGGAGDMGRDIIGICSTPGNVWDNYQCKHYGHPLRPSDIWVELGKLVYYTRRGDYTYPREYYFIAPQGAGTRLSNLFKKPNDLRVGLIDAWDERCRNNITSTGPVDLDQNLRDYILSLDFSIFKVIQPLRLIEQHAKTRWHVYRFGGGLPQRLPAEVPPTEPTVFEANYVRALLDAYGDYLKRSLGSISDLKEESDLLDHFGDSRLEFYSAESLRTFSRDTLPQGEFEKLQEEVHSGIKDEIRANHPDGYRRVLAVVRTARVLPLSAHALSSRLSVRDYGGICHQLANDKKVRWVK
jgi:hypothetical protein